MADKIEDIKSLDELKKAQAAAQSQGSTVTNYSEWSQILKNLEEAGVESTGSFATDKARLQEVEQAVKQYIEEVQNEEKTKQVNKEQDTKVKETSETDKEQALKANLANATSSTLMADYMKYYHML